ncbi:MAG: hypothetical protein OMM_09567 [Candidatus Magnetoglobus multicellularis str. Araruama]|uniref:Uncharacterized protein n=1 Tax=Candidatus Magnetoglobus multicellularis str. Araruama TaxID=890399 RepID=A0A1V1P3V0_9BACT|nr:MAG: hypothetical protein OMM_09567 [Candidatus Magnetoglobus multicellularis str. Araruama]
MDTTHYIDIYSFDQKIGHKNIDCPNYNDCLDKFSVQGDEFWICNQCEHEFNYREIPEKELLKYATILQEVYA